MYILLGFNLRISPSRETRKQHISVSACNSTDGSLWGNVETEALRRGVII